MPAGVTSITPPDDSGSDAFSRYCYQAHVAFPYCLDCALDGGVLAVVPEHFEDIAIERADYWQLIQIKTAQNEDLGPWKLEPSPRSKWRSPFCFADPQIAA